MKRNLLTLAILAGMGCSLHSQTLSNYQHVVASQQPTAYFTLDGTLEDAVGPGRLLTKYDFATGGFATDVFRSPGMAYAFTGQSDYLLYSAANYGTNLLNGGGQTNMSSTAAGSITFIFRTLDAAANTGQRFLFSAGNTVSNGNALGLFLENTNASNGDPNSLKLRFGDTTTTILQASNLVPNAWYYFALTYLESRVPNKAVWYVGKLGGDLESGYTTNAAEAVAGEGADLAIGNNLGLNSAFRNPGSGRLDEFVVWHRELSLAEIGTQFTNLPPGPPLDGTYQEVTAALLPKYYFKFDDSLLDAVGGSLVLSTNGESGAFTTNALGNANAAYSFAQANDALYTTTDLINGGGPGADTTASGTGTISFLFRMLSDTNNTGQRYLFAAPANSANRNQLGLFLENNTNLVNPSSLKLRIGSGTMGNNTSSNPSNNVPVAYPEQLAPNAWYYFAMVYNEAINSGELKVYFGPVGGSLMVHNYDPANDSVVGDNGTLWIGNRDTLTSGFRDPGEGAIDELAIWHEELSAAEINAQFNAVLNTGAPPPSLRISLENGAVLLKWPASAPATYSLEAAPTFISGDWTNAGSPAVVDSEYVVTNQLSSGAMFYRLHRP